MWWKYSDCYGNLLYACLCLCSSEWYFTADIMESRMDTYWVQLLPENLKWLCGWAVRKWLLRYRLWVLTKTFIFFSAVSLLEKMGMRNSGSLLTLWKSSLYTSTEVCCHTLTGITVSLLEILKCCCVLQSLCAHTTTWSLRRLASSSQISKLISSNFLLPYGPTHQLSMHLNRYVVVNILEVRIRPIIRPSQKQSKMDYFLLEAVTLSVCPNLDLKCSAGIIHVFLSCSDKIFISHSLFSNQCVKNPTSITHFLGFLTLFKCIGIIICNWSRDKQSWRWSKSIRLNFVLLSEVFINMLFLHTLICRIFHILSKLSDIKVY